LIKPQAQIELNINEKKTSIEEIEKLKNEFKPEFYPILSNTEERTILDELRKWKFNLQKHFKDGTWKKFYLKSIIFFLIPFIFFIIWIILYITMQLKFFVYIFI